MNQMNYFLQLTIIAVLALVLQSFLPWWSLTIPCAVIGFLYGRSGTSSFLVGFVSIALLWTGLAAWIQNQTGSLLPAQISNLFPGKSVIILFVLTAVVGGLTGGFSTLTGYLLRRLL